MEIRTVGRVKCSHCGKEGDLKSNKKRHLYHYCASPGDGGCGIGTQSRSPVGDAKLAALCIKWSRAEYRREFLSDDLPADPDPEPPFDPEPDPEPGPEPDPEPAPAPKPRVKRKLGPEGYRHPMDDS